MKLIWQALAVIIFIIGVVFALLNAQSVPLNYLLGHITWPLAFYLMITLILGCLIGFVFGWSYRRRR